LKILNLFKSKCWDPRSCLLTDNIARVCPD
jgi:hypothetical protein